MEILPLPHIGNKNLFGWLGFSPSFGKDSDDELPTEQLTAVVDVTFMPHNNPNSLDGHEIHYN